MTEGLAAVFMTPGLGGRDYEQPGFDRPCAQQDMPMRAACGHGEGRGDRDHVRVRLRQSREEHWEPQVVANREPELADRRAVDQHGALAGRIDFRFPPAFARW